MTPNPEKIISPLDAPVLIVWLCFVVITFCIGLVVGIGTLGLENRWDWSTNRTFQEVMDRLFIRTDIPDFFTPME